MAEQLDEVLTQASRENLPVTGVLERLLEAEAAALIERRIERRITESKLPQRKLLSDFDFEFQTGVDQRQIRELATLGFIERKQGLIIGGKSGTGKSHIAKALLLIACQQGYRCRYVTASDMLKDLLAGLADSTLDQKLKKYLSPQVLLIDEIGFDRLEQEEASHRNASLFHKVIDGRYCKGSTMATTNIDFQALGDYLGDPVITTALVDRMVHHSIIISINGPSWRKHQSKQLNDRLNAAETAP
jgi:DNA replication protein DnaC